MPTSLNKLIEAYESRLQSYHFLQDRLDQEMMFTRDAAFVQFCECESKRLQDLIQLCEQVLEDLDALARTMHVDTTDDDADVDPIRGELGDLGSE